MRWRQEYRTFLWLVVSVAVTYVVHIRTLGFWFTNWDDQWLVSRNPVVEEFSARSFKTIWLDLSPDTRRVLGAEYLPVRDTVTILLRHSMGWYPVVFHAANLALYLIGCTLFFVFLLNFSTDVPAVAAATLLFSLHPTHVETVAWISESKSLLSFLFLLMGLLSLITRAKLQQAPLWKRIGLFLLATASFSLSILSKSTAIVFLPLILVLGMTGIWDTVPRNLRRWTWLLFGIQTALHLTLVTRLGREMGMYRSWMGESLFHHLLTIPTLISKYVALLFIPWNVEILSQIQPVSGLLDPRLIVSLLIILPLVLLFFRIRKSENPLLPVSLLWFFMALLPVLQLTPFVVRFASRFLFLPSAAISFLWLGLRRLDLPEWKRNGLGLLAAGSIFFFGWRSNDLLPRWQDCESLWSAVAAQGGYRNVVTANQYHCYLGGEKYPEALRTMTDAIAAEPSRPEHWVDTGRVRLLMDDSVGAEAAFVQARNLGLPLSSFQNNLGVIRMNQQRFGDADRLFRRVLESSPGNVSAWSNLGHIARFNRRWKSAIRFYRRAVLEDPTSSAAWPPLLRITERHGTAFDRRELASYQAELKEFPRSGRRSRAPDFD